MGSRRPSGAASFSDFRLSQDCASLGLGYFRLVPPGRNIMGKTGRNIMGEDGIQSGILTVRDFGAGVSTVAVLDTPGQKLTRKQRALLVHTRRSCKCLATGGAAHFASGPFC
jgi:hypothetical protein